MSDINTTVLQAFADMASGLSNQAIATDPSLQARLHALAGRCVEFQCTAPPLTWHLLVTQSGVQNMAGPSQAPHAVVSGSAAAMSAWLMPNGNRQGLTIDGDESLVIELMEMFKAFKPDLSGGLAQIIGADTAASVVGAAELGLRGLQTLFTGLTESVATQTVGNFVQNPQFNTLLNGIDDLRLRVDRLAANISAAEQRRQTGTK